MAANSNTDNSAAPPTLPPAAAVDAGDDSGAAQVQKLRESGNAAFAAKNMADAKKFYSEALDFATSHGINDSSHECHKIYSNRSLVNYNLNDYEAALSDAEQSLVLDPAWMKGFHRRGLALLALNRNKDAEAAYEQALKLQPHNKVIKSCLKKAKKAVAAAYAAVLNKKTIDTKEEFLSQYNAETDTKVRMATLVTFWNSAKSYERLEFVKRLMKIVGGSTYELHIHALTDDHMVELPNKNYKHIVVPERWIKFFLAQTAADKVTFMESVWLKSKPNEQNLIIQDLQHFFGPSDPPLE